MTYVTRPVYRWNDLATAVLVFNLLAERSLLLKTPAYTLTDLVHRDVYHSPADAHALRIGQLQPTMSRPAIGRRKGSS